MGIRTRAICTLLLTVFSLSVWAEGGRVLAPNLKPETDSFEQAKLTVKADDKVSEREIDKTQDKGSEISSAKRQEGEISLKKSEERSKSVTASSKESEIPFQLDDKTSKKSSMDPLLRLFLTMGVLVVLLAGTMWGIKKYSKDGKTNLHTMKMRVLAQHYLGPKKSLIVVQVAGETILLGVTEQNISMLKNLALIDDEVPEQVPQNFAREMESFDDESGHQDDFALRGLNDVKDIVSTRLKGMRRM